MDFGNEAGEIRVLKRLIERGFVYRGLKPVYWCFDCGSSLAEFEIEYADRKSTDGRRRLPRRRPRKLAAAFGLPSLAKDAFAVIWTTTPWTIPANQALNLNPKLEYSLVDTERGLLRAGERAGREVPGPLRARGPVLASALGAAPRRPAIPPSARRRRSGLRPHRAGLPRRLCDRRRRHRHRPLVAGLRHRRLQLVPRARPGGRRDPQSGAGQRRLRGRAAAVRRHAHLEGEPAIVDALRDAGRLFASSTLVHSYPHCWRHKTPVDLPRRGAVVRAHGRARRATRGVFAVDPAPQTLREMRARRDRRDRVLSGERPRAAARHDRAPARLVHQPAAQLGRAAAALPAQGDAASCTPTRWR